MFNQLTKTRDCINQMIKFVPSTGEFSTVKQSGVVHISRRYHTACSFGKYMFIHGGINNLGKTLKDVQIFDITTNNWVNSQIVPESLNKYMKGSFENLQDPRDDWGPDGLYYHK